jgi:hypothetical protein
VLHAVVHRGSLRADILLDAVLEIGDAIEYLFGPTLLLPGTVLCLSGLLHRDLPWCQTVITEISMNR